jgi:hypothetical protein
MSFALKHCGISNQFDFLNVEILLYVSHRQTKGCHQQNRAEYEAIQAPK